MAPGDFLDYFQIRGGDSLFGELSVRLGTGLFTHRRPICRRNIGKMPHCIRKRS
jgi:hypothetical protein